MFTRGLTTNYKLNTTLTSNLPLYLAIAWDLKVLIQLYGLGLNLSSKAIVSLSVRFFANSSEWAIPKKLKFRRIIVLGVRMVFG